MNHAMPDRGRLAAIDYGDVRLGIAVCDPLRQIASPLENYTRRDAERDASFLRGLCDDEQIVGIVIGLPVHGSGEESAKSIEARQFGAWVHSVTERPVCFFDERYSSAMADQILGQGKLTKKRRKKRRDMIAAQVILAAFLESAAPQTPPTALDDAPG